MTTKNVPGLFLLGLILSSCLTLIAFEYAIDKDKKISDFHEPHFDEVLIEQEEFHTLKFEQALALKTRKKTLSKSIEKRKISHIIPLDLVHKKETYSALNQLMSSKNKRNLNLKKSTEEKIYGASDLALSAYPHFSHCENEDPIAQYKCTQKAILEFLMENTRYPEIPRQLQIEGTVFVSFIINKSGEVENCTVLRSIDKDLDREALRVIKKMPKFKAGRQNGKNVKVRFELPIRFRLAKN